MREQKWIIGIVVAIMAMAGIFFSLSSSTKIADLNNYQITPLGQHLKDSGVKFYGASWCPHCQNAKKMLGDGTWQPIYIECAVNGGNQMEKVCEDAKIEAFPTWEFKDGSRKTGEISLDELEKLTGYVNDVSKSASSTISKSTTTIDVK